MVKKRPQRTCIACRQIGDKRGLIRIVRTPEGQIGVDETGKRAGRGAYLCANVACWRAALDDRRIERALKATPSPEDLARLREYAQALQADEVSSPEGSRRT